jgi:hypothetical protein
MAETDVEQGTSTNAAQGEDEQITRESKAPPPWTDTPAAPAAPEGASHKRGKLIACAALVGGGALAAIRKGRRTRALRQGGRRWPAVPAMLTRTGRRSRRASSGRARKRRCR